MERNCDNCGQQYEADVRNIKRGWGLCCSKSCAAQKREKAKPDYNPKRVAENNVRREQWNKTGIDENLYGVYRGRRTSEGYKIYGTTAMNEWDEPVYEVDEDADDPGDSEYWDSKDFS